MEITSLTNTNVKQWMKLKEKKHRDKQQRFLIEGEHLIQEAEKAHLIETIILEKGRKIPYSNYEIYEVTKEVMNKLSDRVSKAWIMAVCKMPSYELDKSERLVVLDGVQDPGNVGTIIRTAYSFGYSGILLSQQCADVYNEKVIRSTQGAVFHIPVMRGDILSELQKLKKSGMHLYATSLHDAKPLQDIQLKRPYAWIFGNEGKGICNEVLSLSDERVYIEMLAFESLNVGVATGICMYKGML